MLRTGLICKAARYRASSIVGFVLYTMIAVGCGQSYTSNTPPDKIVYLTWQRDHTRTMTIHWLSASDDTTNVVRFGAVKAELISAAKRGIACVASYYDACSYR